MRSIHNIEDLNMVREYFSHNIRTSTAMVMASVMVFKCGLADDADHISDVITESAYFLDVYDKGMDILFSFVLGDSFASDADEICPSKVIKHFINQVPITIEEQGLNITFEGDDFKLNSNSHILRNLIEMILCEEVRKSKGNLKITEKEGVCIIEREFPVECPKIYYIFEQLFKKLNIDFSYGKNRIEMRFIQ